MKRYFIKYGVLFCILIVLRLGIATFTGAPLVDSVSVLTLVGLMAVAILLDVQNKKTKKSK